MTQQILIIEDETRIAHWVQSYLERAGFATMVADNGIDGLRLAQEKQPHLIVLDLMLPGIDGIDVCKTLRKASNVPIIMLTARGRDLDRILGLELGADDYVVKPFNPDELVARVRAVLRRIVPPVHADAAVQPTTIQAGRVKLDTAALVCWVDGQEVDLSRTQWLLLETLVRHAGRVLSRQQLLDACFEGDYEGFERTIDVHIRRIRLAIEPDPSQPRHIVTVFGVGYKFVV